MDCSSFLSANAQHPSHSPQQTTAPELQQSPTDAAYKASPEQRGCSSCMRTTRLPAAVHSSHRAASAPWGREMKASSRQGKRVLFCFFLNNPTVRSRYVLGPIFKSHLVTEQLSAQWWPSLKLYLLLKCSFHSHWF